MIYQETYVNGCLNITFNMVLLLNLLHSVNVEAQILLQQQTGLLLENEVNSSLLTQEEALEFVKITNLYL